MLRRRECRRYSRRRKEGLSEAGIESGLAASAPVLTLSPCQRPAAELQQRLAPQTTRSVYVIARTKCLLAAAFVGLLTMACGDAATGPTPAAQRSVPNFSSGSTGGGLSGGGGTGGGGGTVTATPCNSVTAFSSSVGYRSAYAYVQVSASFAASCSPTYSTCDIYITNPDTEEIVGGVSCTFNKPYTIGAIYTTAEFNKVYDIIVRVNGVPIQTTTVLTPPPK